MTEESGFLQAILASPSDVKLRLVYADWLEERRDVRGDYLRLEHALASARPRSRKASVLRRSLQQMRGQMDSGWLALFDQPALLRANPTPFPATWLSVDLPGYRPMPATYGGFPYESLPPLPIELFHGDLRWLKKSGQRPAAKGKPSKQVERLAGAAAALGLTLPAEFGVFMASRALRRRIRSCTDCFFSWPARIVECPDGEGGYLVRFYSDSQGCLHWYLYLTPPAYHCVVVTGGSYGDSEEGDDEDEPADEIYFCAPSLEAFLYRTWIENEIWFALCEDETPLSAEQLAYVGHYAPP